MSAQLSFEDLKRSGRATCSVEEAAQVLNIGRGMAYSCAQNNEIPVLRLGAHKLLVSVPALIRLLENCGCSGDHE
jgi:excisionase family DNA binding protein